MSRAAPVPQRRREPWPPAARPLPPVELLRSGRADSTLLLSLWIVRQVGQVLLILGLIPPILTGQFTASLGAQLDTPRELLDSLLTPLVVLALGLLLQFTASATALVLAFPRTEAEGFDGRRTPARGPMMRLYDRFCLARGRRQLRWSWAVRRAAAARLGDLGTVLEGFGRVAAIATGPAVLLVLLALMLFT